VPYKDKEKAKLQSKQYYLKHKEQKKEYQKRFYLKNKERLQKYKKEYIQKIYNDPEKHIIFKQKRTASARAWRTKDIGRQKKMNHEYYLKNKEKITAKNKIYYKTEEYRAKRRKLNKIWREKNKEHYLLLARVSQRKRYHKKREEILMKHRDWYLNRRTLETKNRTRDWKRNWDRKQRATNPAYKIKYNIKCRLGLLLRKQKITKNERTLDYIGCSFEDLKNHLEKQFQPGMSWGNRTEWHIDHIIPINYFIKNFDFTDINVQKKCFHYTNLRPLWKFDNLSKGTKIILGDITSPKM
jgi:hypothetical protein